MNASEQVKRDRKSADDTMIVVSRRPTHPGALLREDFMPEYGLGASGLAEALGVSRQTVYELMNERRAVSPEMAWRLSVVFHTSPQFWMNLQRNIDLWDAMELLRPTIGELKPVAQ